MRQFLTILSFIAAASAACPRIVSRAEWGARPPVEEFFQEVPVPFVVIHHGASEPCFDQDSCSAMVRAYQNLHMNTNGWPDIGYNFLVGEDGNIYEGRGWDRVGAHAPGYNFNSIGVCFIGTFSGVYPNDLAVSAARMLFEQCGIELGLVQSAYQLLGHRQALSTECPGETLYNLIQTWPNWVPITP